MSYILRSETAKDAMKKEGAVPKTLLDEIKTSLAQQASRKQIASDMLSSLEKWRDPEAPPINEESLIGLIKRQEDLVIWMKDAKNLVKKGRSLFSMDARNRDKERGSDYWGSSKEMLARASEPFWSMAGHPVLSQTEDDDTSSPVGTEQTVCNQAFERFFPALVNALTKTQASPELSTVSLKEKVQKSRTETPSPAASKIALT